MKTAARLMNIFLLLITGGAFFAGILESRQLDAGGVLGLILLVGIMALPTVPPLLSIGKNRIKIERLGIIVNKLFLFLLAAAFVGIILSFSSVTQAIPMLPLGVFLTITFTLNIVALQGQHNGRITAM